MHKRMIVGEDVRVVLDGEEYLLEKGDIISICENGHWQVVGGHPGLANNPKLSKAAESKGKKEGYKHNLSMFVNPPKRKKRKKK